jgi:CheY-like chemotaxis protein
MNETILVVDDNAVNRRLLSSVLTMEGYHPIEAESGPQALAMAAQSKPDAVMLDIMMPGMDGFEVYEKLAQSYPQQDMPVLFLSALNGADDKVRGLKLGADDYITKPFERGEVLARLRSRLDSSQSRSLLAREKRRLVVEAERRDDDVSQAVNLQQSLFPAPRALEPSIAMEIRRYPPQRLSSEIHVAFRLNRSELFFALVDAGGPGLAGAMAAVSLARLLHGRPGGILRPKLDNQPGYAVATPAAVVKALIKEFPMRGMDYPASVNILMVNAEKGLARYANLGGANPLKIPKKGGMEWLKGDLPPGGTSLDVGFRQGEFAIEKGDKLLFATDGVHHATDGQGRPLGRNGLTDVICRFQPESISRLVSGIDRCVSDWARHTSHAEERTIAGLEFLG